MTETGILASVAREKAKEICKQLSLEEKIELLGGRDIARMNGISRLDIPSLKTSDGPSGIRGAQTGLEFVVGFPFYQHQPNKPPLGSAVFPCATALAATWNEDCVKEVAKAIAKDGKSKNVNIALAPTINIIRDPRGGRSFECFSEDPFLTAQIGAAWTNGCQDLGKLLVCLKHFCGNECETERHRSNTIVDQVTLREVYMRPFELIIKILKRNGFLEPGSIMMGYNQLNGIPCSTNQFLIKDVLRQQWNYKGLTMSDWFGTANGEESVKAGLDIEMPGPPVKRRKEGIMEAIQDKRIKEDETDQLVYNILSIAILAKLLATHDLDNVGPELFTDEEIKNGKDQEQATSKNSQADFEDLLISSSSSSCVLLKNLNNCLPIQPNQVKNVVVIGEPAILPIQTGGGSARMPAYDSISAYDEIKEELKGYSANVKYYSGGFKLSNLIKTPNKEQLQNQKIIFSWHKMKINSTNNTYEIEKDPYHIEERETTELRNWFGGMQSPDSHFAVRTSFKLQPTRSGCHTISLQAFGEVEVKVFEEGENKQIGHWTHKGESSGPEFMFHPHKLLEKFPLRTTKERQNLNIQLEYRMPIKQVGPVPEKGGAFRFAIQEEPVLSRKDEIEQAIEAAKSADVVLLFTGTGPEYESEGIDRQDINLPDEQDRVVEEIVSSISPNKTKTVVINSSGSAVSMPWAENDNVQAILQSWFAGQRGGKAIANILFGKRQPLGRLPITWPKSIQDHSSFENFPCKKEGTGFSILYDEKTLIGHRWYEAKMINPLFWFGFGLSYSKIDVFTTQDREFSMKKDGFAQICINVKNLSEQHFAKHTIQLYLLNGAGDSKQHARSLVGFVNTDIKPKNTEMVTIKVHKEALARWNVELNEWMLKEGKYTICIASSSNPNDEYCRVTINVDESSHWI